MRKISQQKVTGDVPTVRIDRAKFSEWCESVGHSETSLSSAYRGSSYLSHRFLLYDGVMPAALIEWCSKMYPAAKDKLAEAVIPDTPPEEKKPEPKPEPTPEPEQMTMTFPSVMKDKIVTVQPVSLVGINKIVDALNLIAERLQKLEEAWSGQKPIEESVSPAAAVRAGDRQ